MALFRAVVLLWWICGFSSYLIGWLTTNHVLLGGCRAGDIAWSTVAKLSWDGCLSVQGDSTPYYLLFTLHSVVLWNFSRRYTHFPHGNIFSFIRVASLLLLRGTGTAWCRSPATLIFPWICIDCQSSVKRIHIRIQTYPFDSSVLCSSFPFRLPRNRFRLSQ